MNSTDGKIMQKGKGKFKAASIDVVSETKDYDDDQNLSDDWNEEEMELAFHRSRYVLPIYFIYNL